MAFILTAEAERFQKGLQQLQNILSQTGFDKEISVSWQPAEGLEVEYENGAATIRCNTPSAFYRGLGHLLEKTQAGHKAISLHEKARFRHLGASFDLSRNSVLRTDTLKRIICQMALMGFDELYLYTEDTYQLDGYPFFGYLRGRYSCDELRELDAFALELGIELIPCIQTLGHLERFLHWQASAHLRDTPDVLLVGSEETYALIDKMFEVCSQCYHTKKIHVGMDEAMQLGLGRYLQKSGFKNSFEIMLEHVKRVNELARKHGLEPMMWSDMYFRCASPNNDYYEDEIEIPQWVVDAAPQNVGLVYWDYYHTDKAFYDRYIRLHQQFAAPLSFAGGMWTWLGPAIDYEEFFKKSVPALYSCLENGVQDVMITTWGDDGGETPVRTMLLGLMTYAEFCYTGEFCKQQLFERLNSCFGADAEMLCKISAFNKTPLLSPESDLPNGAKFLLYQDPLVGIYDADAADMGFAQQYAQLHVLFDSAAQRADAHWQPVYRFYALLAKVLANKAELGWRLYIAYQQNEKETLLALAQQAEEAGCDAWELLECWRQLWMADCKPFGFEVLELRMAGVASRLRTAAQRVRSYCSGETPRLEELEEQRLHLLRKENSSCMNGVYFWKEIVSACKAF